MRRRDDPKEMTPAERLREVAATLATGYMRLVKRASNLGEPLDEAAENAGKGAKNGPFADEKSSDFLREGLDVPVDRSPHGR
jgi:hypothetical protein